MSKRRRKNRTDPEHAQVIFGRCSVCGHEGGIVEGPDLCGACCFGEAAAQAELDEEVGDDSKEVQ